MAPRTRSTSCSRARTCIPEPGDAGFHGLAADALALLADLDRDLLPFPQLDGYFMISHTLGTVNRRVDSYRYWSLLLARLAGRGKARPPIAPPRSVRITHPTYGAASTLFGAGLLVTLASGTATLGPLPRRGEPLPYGPRTFFSFLPSWVLRRPMRQRAMFEPA